jgi:hypothetical protein
MVITGPWLAAVVNVRLSRPASALPRMSLTVDSFKVYAVL